MGYFDDGAVKLDVLKERAFNYRWAEVDDGVIPLTAADPDFPVAPQVIDAMKSYLDGGYLSYTPKLGLPEFREEIAKSLNSRKNENVNAEWVLPIDSAARGMYITAQALLKPGDEMIVFDPVDYLFGQAALAAGAKPVLFPAVIKDEKIDLSELEKYITPKTKMIGLCNPHNPWGTVYTEEDLETILQLAEKYDLWIMNDEIWSDIVYSEKPFKSILSLSAERNHRIISVYGFSKSFGVAGLRIGCIYCHGQDIFEKIVETSHVLTTAGGIASISQIAGIACLRHGYSYVEEFVAHLTRNRDYAYERLNQMKGISAMKPQATYLIFPDITGTGMESQAFVDFMTENAKVAFVPGTEKFFGPGAEGHIRICFATSHAILKEGLDRLEMGLSLIK